MIDLIAKHLSDWLHENSFRPRYTWDSKTETPILGGSFGIPADIDLDIDDEWLVDAAIEPKDAIEDLLRQARQQCDVGLLELHVGDFLLIIEPALRAKREANVSVS